MLVESRVSAPPRSLRAAVVRGYTKPMVTEREPDAAISTAERVEDLLAQM